jgi:transcriptional regulator with XRE-family HTH domain
MKEIAKIIGTRIKMLRFAKHMQQTELAQRMEISQTHMSNIESGRNNVTLENLFKLHEILECPMSSFFVDIDGKEEVKDAKDVFSIEDLAQALILLKKQ